MGFTKNEFQPDDVFNELNRKFANVSLESPSSTFNYRDIDQDDLIELRDILKYSDNFQDIYQALKSIRRYLTQNISVDRIQHVFDLNILDKIRDIFIQPGFDELKYEASWTVTNLAYGTSEQTDILMECGLVDALMVCLRVTDNYRVKAQSAWALANVSIESPNHREYMANHKIIGEIAQALENKCNIVYNKFSTSMYQYDVQKSENGYISTTNKMDSDDVKDLTWSLANICRGGFKTVEHWQQYLVAFTALSQAINFENQEIWSEACWGLSRILSNMYSYDPFFATLELNPGLCPRVIHLLKNQNINVVLPVLQTISNFSSGPNNYIEILLNADLLNSLWWYMTPDTHQALRRNAILTTANLAAGNEGIVRKVVYNENIMRNVIAHITIPGYQFNAEECKWVLSRASVVPDTKDEWRIVKETLWVLSNITTLAHDDSICALLRNYSKLIKSLSSLLFYEDLSLTVCLKIVDVMIRLVERTNQITELTPPVYPSPRNAYAEEMVREGVIQAINHLSQHYQSVEFNEQVETLQTAIMVVSPQQQQEIVAAAGLASEFGLLRNGMPGANRRRIVQSYDDGDVRLIEDAINSIQL